MNRKESYMGYLKPEVKAIRLEVQSQLMDTSFPNDGGHKKAGDDGADLSAKQGWFDEEEEETFED